MAYTKDCHNALGLPLINGGARPFSAGYDVNRIASYRGGVRTGVPTAWPASSCYGSDPFVYPPRPPAEQIQTQDQLRHCREEVARKDRLINQLTMIDGQRHKGGDFKYDDMYNASSNYINTGPFIKQDAGLHVRVESLTNQVRELQAQVDARDTKLREMKHLQETCREAEARNAAAMHALRQNLAMYEAQFGQLEGAANRSGYAVSALQKENHEAQQRILELESRLRTHLEERERAEQERTTMERRFMEMNSHFSTFNGGEALTSDQIIHKTKELVQENLMLKGQMATMQDHFMNVENEVKASRETIARLIGEAEKGQMSASRYTLDMEGVRLERDCAIARQNELQRENEELRDRLDSTQRAWNTMRQDLDQRKTCHDPTEISRNIESQSKAFKECLATLLSDGVCAVEPYEEVIRDRVHDLVVAVRDKNARIESLEREMGNVSNQLDAQLDLSRSVDRKNKRAEADLADMEERLRRCDDGGRYANKQPSDSYIQLLELLNRALGMNPFPVDLSLDGARDAIVMRAEQLYRLETELADKKIHIHNLQRKVKSLKEKLNSKDEYLRLDAEKDKDEENKNRKLINLIEKYKAELNETHIEIRDLKSRLSDAGDLQNRARLSERDLEKLEGKLQEIDHIREAQATRIAEQLETIRGLQGDQNRVHHVTDELRAAQTAIGDITKRNRQLLELRQVISRMLGLDVRAMSVADVEIVQRLEKLILANQASASSTFIIDTSINDMVEGYRRGFDMPEANLLGPTTTPQRGRQEFKVGGVAGGRSRSLSPNKKRDSKVY